VLAKLEQGIAQLIDGLIARVRVPRAGPLKDGRQLLRHVGTVRVRFAAHGSRHGGQHGVAAVAQLARRRMVQAGTQQEHVRTDVRAPARHLGWHVGRRPRQPVGGVVGQAPGYAPVQQVHLAEVPDHDVVGLDVAVQHATAVGESTRLADLQDDLDVALERRARVDQLVPRTPADALHDHGRAFGVLHHRVHRHDVRVLELARDDGLFEQLSRGPFRGRVRALHRHLAQEGALLGEPDSGHPALAQHVLQPVVALTAERQ
jgi:hypothetical protein